VSISGSTTGRPISVKGVLTLIGVRCRPVRLTAVTVQADNVEAVAAWCGGRPWPVGRPRCVRLAERTTGGLGLPINAHPGDHIVRLPDGTHRQIDPTLWAVLFTEDAS
jgi:hypothetical protein